MCTAEDSNPVCRIKSPELYLLSKRCRAGGNLIEGRPTCALLPDAVGERPRGLPAVDEQPQATVPSMPQGATFAHHFLGGGSLRAHPLRHGLGAVLPGAAHQRRRGSGGHWPATTKG